jgi:hypothetical protein
VGPDGEASLFTLRTPFLPSQNLEEVFLGLAGLTQEIVEEALRPNLRVTVGDRDTAQDRPLLVDLHPDLVVSLSGEIEAIAAQDLAEVAQPRRQERRLFSRRIGSA